MSATAFQRKRREEAAKLKEAASKDEKTEMTVKQIKAILDEKGIEYDTKAKKPDLIALLESALILETPTEEPPEDREENDDDSENEDAE